MLHKRLKIHFFILIKNFLKLFMKQRQLFLNHTS